MVARCSIALALLVLGGCTVAEPERPAEEGVATVEAPAEAPVAEPSIAPTPADSQSPPPADALPAEELRGEYRVAGVDGGDIDMPHALTASIADRRIQVVSGCVKMAWRYTYERGRLATTYEPLITCTRALWPEEKAVFAAIEAAERVTRTPANGIELSGGGRSVTLFSQ